MGKVTQWETLLTFEETMLVQQRHEKLKVEETVSQQSSVSSTGEGGFHVEETRYCWKTWPSLLLFCMESQECT